MFYDNEIYHYIVPYSSKLQSGIDCDLVISKHLVGP